MKNALDLLQEGMHGQNLKKIMDSIASIQQSNPIVWFTVYKVLERINNEWDEEILPNERVNTIENRFKEPLSKVAENIDRKSLNEIIVDLENLIKAYISEYIQRY